MIEPKLLVRKIEKGTVIDHISSGKSSTILKILKLRPNEKVVIATNIDSKSMGQKDIIKIEDRDLTSKEVDIISLVSPSVTINHVDNWQVKNKFRVKLPDLIEDVLRCPNLFCITNAEREPIKTEFKTIKSTNIEGTILQCKYCNSLLKYEEISNYLKV